MIADLKNQALPQLTAAEAEAAFAFARPIGLAPAGKLSAAAGVAK